jgi:hypothetical protein
MEPCRAEDAHNGGVEAQNGGSVDPRITLMRSRIQIRIKVKSWIRIRIKVKIRIRICMKVIGIRNSGS